MLDKVDPYLRPLFDALYDMLDGERLNTYMERGTIEVAPLAFMRGRTLNDSFIILDEAQNTSPEQMQMFLTRLGFGSKVVVTGEGVGEGELGLQLVGPEEMRDLKQEHLGIDEPTDALAFPIDGRDTLPDGLPRQLGDVVLCPQVVGDVWRPPLVHAVLHLLGYDHGAEMERREREYA